MARITIAQRIDKRRRVISFLLGKLRPLAMNSWIALAGASFLRLSIRHVRFPAKSGNAIETFFPQAMSAMLLLNFGRPGQSTLIPMLNLLM
jgi:hypothetical protein